MLRITLLILWTAPLLPLTGLDISSQGNKVILQEEVETILVKTNMTAAFNLIERMKLHSDLAVRQLVTNHLKKGLIMNSWAVKARNVLSTLHKMVMSTEVSLEQLFTEPKENDIDKRALEFLGEALSGLTGVPSAAEHRKIIAEMKLLHLDNEGIQNLMASTTKSQKEILSALHVHSSTFLNISHDLSVIEKEQDSLKKDIENTLNLLEFQNNILFSDIEIREIIRKANDILIQGKNEFISKYAIGLGELAMIIRKISNKHLHVQPVYSEKEVDRYFSEKIAHSWSDRKKSAIFTLLQIPLANFEKEYTVTVLPTLLTKHPELDIVLVHEQSNSFRFLSDSELKDCIDLGPMKLCQKRKIAIYPEGNCRLDSADNCNDWTRLVVHDLNSNDILFMSEKQRNATLECENEGKKIVKIPNEGVVTLSGKCRLAHDDFVVERLQHSRFEAALDKGFAVKDVSWESFEDFEPLKRHDFMEAINETDRRILNAYKLTNEHEIELEKFKNESRYRWENLDEPMTGWEKIVMQILIGVNLIISALLIVYIVISGCKANNQLTIGMLPFTGQPDNTRAREDGEAASRIQAIEAKIDLINAVIERAGLHDAKSIREEELSIRSERENEITTDTSD
jgi:hypothetical protein